MEWGVEQPDADRIALHGAEDGLEVAALHGQQLRERLAPPGFVLCHDHLAHGREPVALEEHVLGTAQAYALGAEVAAPMRVGRRVRVDTHPDVPELIGPFHEPHEVAGHLGRDQRGLAGVHPAALPSTVIQSPSRSTRCPTLSSRCCSSTSRCCAAATHGVPMPRATTAAWLVMPPRAVRIALATIMPWKSSGDVSVRTRITDCPRAPAARRGWRRRPACRSPRRETPAGRW